MSKAELTAAIADASGQMADRVSETVKGALAPVGQGVSKLAEGMGNTNWADVMADGRIRLIHPGAEFYERTEHAWGVRMPGVAGEGTIQGKGKGVGFSVNQSRAVMDILANANGMLSSPDPAIRSQGFALLDSAIKMLMSTQPSGANTTGE